MDEYISREATAKTFCEKCKGYYDGHCVQRGECDVDVIQTAPAADVQPLSVVAEHIKNRLYETAFNTTETEVRNAIVNMAGRIELWVNELKEGEHND